MKPFIKRKKPEPYIDLGHSQRGVAITFGAFTCDLAPLHYDGDLTLELYRKGDLLAQCEPESVLTAVLTKWPTVYFPFDQNAYGLARGWYTGSLYQGCTELQCGVTFRVGQSCVLTAQTQEQLCEQTAPLSFTNPNTKPRQEKLYTGCIVEGCACDALNPCEERIEYTLTNCNVLDDHIAQLQAELEQNG